MTEILLIRHGQASLGGANYDQLSELGYQQAAWLAEHLVATGLGARQPLALRVGAMARQHQTAAALLDALALPPAVEDPGFNEFDFESVVLAFLGQNPDYPLPDTPSSEELYALLKIAIQHWADDRLPLSVHQESWQAFHQRVAAAWTRLVTGLEQSAQDTASTLVVTSGGVIASIVRLIEQLDDAATIDLNLKICNASVTRIAKQGGQFKLSGFNLVPHLERQDRAHAVTFA